MLKKMVWGIMGCVAMFVVLFLSMFSFGLAVSKNKDKTIQKYKIYFGLMSDWMGLLENGYSFKDYLQKNGYDRLAVYGGRDAGQHLVEQLRCMDDAVQYIIDKSAFADRPDGLKVYRPSDKLPPVDAVIVTPVWDFYNIEQGLIGRVDCPVISLKDMIAEVKNG